MESLCDRVALVTGASSGIGKAIALRLGQAGAQVVLVARRETVLHEVAELLGEQGCQAEVQCCDLGDDGQLDALCTYLEMRETSVDTLVNCAGSRHTRPFLDTDQQMWDAEIRLNMVAPLRLAKAFARRLRRERKPGCLVNIASVAANVGVPGAAMYCATKGAVVAWGRAVAAEWAKANIRVISVCPGFVRTPMLSSVGKLLPTSAMEALEAAHPAGFGEPEDVAEVVACVVGKAGRWMTGNVVTVDGGYSMV